MNDREQELCEKTEKAGGERNLAKEDFIELISLRHATGDVVGFDIRIHPGYFILLSFYL